MASLSSVIVRSTTNVPNGTTNNAAVFDLRSRDLPYIVFAVSVTAIPVGGAPTLDVFIQESLDGGNTWLDRIHTQFTAVVGTRVFRLDGTAPTPSTPDVPDGTMTGETIRQGFFSGQFRLKTVSALGGGSGQYTGSVTAYM